MMKPYTLKKDKLYQELRQEILSGHYAPESRLPNEQDFSRQLGVGTVTLRSALEKLEADGLVARVPGKGTFISTERRSNLILVGIVRKSGMELPQNYILPGIEAAAAEQGFRTELCFIEYLRKLKQENALELLKKKNLCGVLLIASAIMPDDPVVLLLRQLGLPVIVVHGRYEDRLTGFSLMYVDMRRAWKDGLEYLAGKGHRDIRIIGMPGSHDIRGWRKEELPGLFRSLGLNSEGCLVYPAVLETDSIRHAVNRILNEGGQPSAIFCFSDFYAMEVMACLQEKGVRVPEDIAVMGYCGYPGATLLEPSLSTIDLNYAGIGRASVELLASAGSWFRVEDAAIPVVTIPYRIVERNSTRIIRNDPNIFSRFNDNILEAK